MIHSVRSYASLAFDFVKILALLVACITMVVLGITAIVLTLGMFAGSFIAAFCGVAAVAAVISLMTGSRTHAHALPPAQPRRFRVAVDRQGRRLGPARPWFYPRTR